MMSLFSFRTIYFSLLLTLPISLFAGVPAKPTKERMLADFAIMKSTFELKYAPNDWKKKYAGWDLEKESKRVKEKIMRSSSITIKDYQKILKEFFNSTRDYHVGISFYSTELALLPFRVHSAEGRYFVAWSIPDFPLKPGDEVLQFNGKAIREEIEAVKKRELGNAGSATDDRLAERILTFRSGSRGHQIPEGEVKMVVRHKNAPHPVAYRMEWWKAPEEVINPVIRPKGAKTNPELFFRKEMTTAFLDYFQQGDKFKRCEEDDDEDEWDDDYFIGSLKSGLPPLGEILWESPYSYFDAYICKAPSGLKVGFVRIPSYTGNEYLMDEMVEIINHFESETDAMVVDQQFNPGGSLFYAYGLLSLMSDAPLKTVKEKLTLTQEDVMGALGLLDLLEHFDGDDEAAEFFSCYLDGFAVDSDFIENLRHYFYFVLNEWSEGKLITDPTYLFGVEHIKPHPRGHYSKPILFMVNSLAFSCGDFVPAILQDNGRATIFGARTAGAGGVVYGQSFPNLFGIAGFRYTASLGERDNLDPIENLGVTPDIGVEVTVRDLQEGYPDYVRAIHNAVDTISSEDTEN